MLLLLLLLLAGYLGVDDTCHYPAQYVFISLLPTQRCSPSPGRAIREICICVFFPRAAAAAASRGGGGGCACQIRPPPPSVGCIWMRMFLGVRNSPKNTASFLCKAIGPVHMISLCHDMFCQNLANPAHIPSDHLGEWRRIIGPGSSIKPWMGYSAGLGRDEERPGTQQSKLVNVGSNIKWHDMTGKERSPISSEIR